MSSRVRLKKIFDRIVFTYPSINWLLRNVNKLFSGLTSFRLRPFGVMRVRYKNGVSFKMATNETSSVTKLLFWKGPDNYEYTSIFNKLVLRCNVFFDIGANTGYYSLLAAVRNPGTQVYAFEPASAPHHYLTRNIAINRLKNVKAYQLALSDQEGELTFFELDNPEHYHSKYNLAGTGTLKLEGAENQLYVSRKVRSTTLDKWMSDENVRKVDLIKLDTEGTEDLILRGADYVLREHQPVIICEILFKVIEDKLEQIMRQYDYHFFYYKEGKLFTTETLVRETDNGVRDCFFVPTIKLDWVKGFLGEPESA